ncbi:DUF3302 domain-containing protein [Hyphomicrobium sp. NDB2Meth4]|uniref:DUF3302 domain-containing protein n=1 Tax=Hyphomicrobium sp. NDB2Meth4 TaxID=1892846 RepID=UPI000930C556|nr:DUF3302 domain-containing protein [Hyphomicrobium sp. NDB2Meth4]
MTLDYVALFLLIAIISLVIYGTVAVYGIPHEIAKARNHPHQDAIGAATWVSLLTLGALWPFLWIWALAYRPDRGWGFAKADPGADMTSALAELKYRVASLEQRAKKPVL